MVSELRSRPAGLSGAPPVALPPPCAKAPCPRRIAAASARENSAVVRMIVSIALSFGKGTETHICSQCRGSNLESIQQNEQEQRRQLRDRRIAEMLHFSRSLRHGGSPPRWMRATCTAPFAAAAAPSVCWYHSIRSSNLVAQAGRASGGSFETNTPGAGLPYGSRPVVGLGIVSLKIDDRIRGSLLASTVFLDVGCANNLRGWIARERRRCREDDMSAFDESHTSFH